MKLITLDPGHFHAALFQKEMLPGVADEAHVYAPPGPDLQAHVNRIQQFNSRSENPTHWKLEVHADPNCLERLLAERRGNVVVISGRNRGKIDRLLAVVQAGLHVLADKPWIIEPAELPKLQSALDAAEQQGVVAYDAMTQRFEISCLLQRELVNDPEIFGTCSTGSELEPAVRMESVHYLLKEVAGAPLLRPAWFFDIRQQGEGLADAGTHLVDLVPWTLFPEQAINYQTDIQVQRGERWPTALTPEQFQRVTGEKAWPEFLVSGSSRRQEALLGESDSGNPQSEIEKSLLTSAVTRNERLEYFANNRVDYTIRGVHVRLDVRWEYEAPPGGKDTELAVFRGSKAGIEVRQGKEERYQPEVYVVPNQSSDTTEILKALHGRIASLQKTYPGLAVENQGQRLRVIIPDRYRIGHEAHFGLLARQFLDYVRHPQRMPAWEKPNMLAKYYVTTKGIELARRSRVRR